MITGRIVKTDDDLKRVNELLASNSIENITDLNEKNTIYILEEDDRIIGVCEIENYNSYGILRYIVIFRDFRGQKLGDGLLRATFNYCLRNGIQEIYYDKKDSFLASSGFSLTSSDVIPKTVREKIPSDEILQCNLEDFFSKGCKCKGELDEK